MEAVHSSGGGGADEPASIDTADDSIAIKGCAAALVEEFQVEPIVALLRVLSRATSNKLKDIFKQTFPGEQKRPR